MSYAGKSAVIPTQCTCPFDLCNPQDNTVTDGVVTCGVAQSGCRNDSALTHSLMSEALLVLHHLKKTCQFLSLQIDFRKLEPLPHGKMPCI